MSAAKQYSTCAIDGDEGPITRAIKPVQIRSRIPRADIRGTAATIQREGGAHLPRSPPRGRTTVHATRARGRLRRGTRDGRVAGCPHPPQNRARSLSLSLAQRTFREGARARFDAAPPPALRPGPAAHHGTGPAPRAPEKKKAKITGPHAQLRPCTHVLPAPTPSSSSTAKQSIA
jgi:hypothetical protein